MVYRICQIVALCGAANSGVVCPMTGVAQQTVCLDGWSCVLKHSGSGACHFEYPPDVAPHRENCYGCRKNGKGQVCEPNLPNVQLSTDLPNVLVVGDSVSHGYFPALVAMLNGSVHLQHAPSNNGNMADGVACFNTTTAMGGTGKPVVWDLITFNFGLHDTFVPTPPPRTVAPESSHRLPTGESLKTYMRLLREYTDFVRASSKGLFVLTTPLMKNDVYEVLEVMNANASEYMASVGVPTADLYTIVADYCGPLPYTFCDICQGSLPDKPADCRTTPHYTEEGYQLLASALAESIKQVLGLQSHKSSSMMTLV